MNKKMIYVSRKLEGLRATRPVKGLLAEAEKDLFRGQCNCAYWHGVFGGLYMFHLRRAVYHHLIRSEALMDNVRHGKKQFCEADVLDMDADGFDEVVLENRELSLCFAPAGGGMLKELDSKRACQNLMNTLARRKEAYHRRILEQIEEEAREAPGEVRTIHDDTKTVNAGIREHMDYDRYPRYGLIDHFLGPDVDIDAFSRCVYHEAGDFVNGIYDFEVERHHDRVTLAMKREGVARGAAVYLAKEITLPKKGASFTVRYTIVNREDRPVDLAFGPEFNVTMPDADSERYSLILDDGEKRHCLGDKVRHDTVNKIEIRDARKELSFEMMLSEKCRFWHFPVKTVSRSEKAYELNYQSSAILPQLEVRLGAGEKKEFCMEVRVVSSEFGAT